MNFKMPTSITNSHSVSNISKLQNKIRGNAGNVYSLPENWPKIPQLKEYHWMSELSNCKTPSVRRAISHIELVQNIIDEWFLRVIEQVKARTSSNFPTPEVQRVVSYQEEDKKTLNQQAMFHLDCGEGLGEKKQLKFQSENSLVTSDHHSHRVISAFKALSFGTSDMTVTGQNVLTQKEDGRVDIPDLGAQEVIVEVITLIAELENDRMETLVKYTKESKRAELLRQKIDNLQLHHLQELPALVQREHEACLMDLAELHWHVTYTRRLQTRAQSRFTVSNKQNMQLREDIDFVKKHVPLVQEKLVLEVEAMDKIRKAQGETDQELVMAQQRQAKTEVKSLESLGKASTERAHIKIEMDTARYDLTEISQQLSKAQMTYKSYVQKINDIHDRLGGNKQEMDVLREKSDKARTTEERQVIKVKNLQADVTEAEFEHKQLEAKKQQQEQLLDVNKDKHASGLTSLEQQRKTLDVQLWKLARKKQEQIVDIQECEEKIAKCNQQKATDLKNMTRINQELEKTTLLLQQTIDQHQHFFGINLQLKEQLQTEQYEIFQTEDKLKKMSESLKRQIQEEIHTKTVLEARIRSDLSEIEKAKFDLEKKKEKAKAVADELTQAISVVVQKVTKLKVTKAEMIQTREHLSNKISETEKEHKENSERFNQTLGRIEPESEALKGQLGVLNEQLLIMDQQSEWMNRKIDEMNTAQIIMDKVAATLEQSIQVLMSEIHELNLQIESSRKIVDDLHKQFNNTLERLRDNESCHKQLHNERKNFLDTQETNKTEVMEINKGLASRYRQLQQRFIAQKEELLKSYEERIKLESAIKDMKQLKSFQSKLHSALIEYFKYRGLHSEMELAKLEEESSENGVRVSHLQMSMERALADIADFINSREKAKVAKNSVRETPRNSKIFQRIPPLEHVMKPDGTNIGVKVEQS